MNNKLIELIEKEKLICENVNEESAKKDGEDIEVYSNEFFSKAKVDGVSAKPFNFDEIADKCERLTEDGGVMKLLTKRGTGDVVPATSSVLIKFSAFAEYADVPFDFCRTPVTIDLGSSMLRGMNIALASMRKGEKASFYMQPKYAYGKVGCIKPFVPPESLCLFVIELVDYEERGGAGEYFDLSPAERKTVPLATILGIGKIKKKEAERHFRNKDYERAKSIYERLVKDLMKYEPDDKRDKLEHKDMLLKSCYNASLCYLNLEDYHNCIKSATQALDIDPNCAKALYFKAKALTSLGDVDKGLEVMMQAYNLMPNDKHINEQLHAMNKIVGERNKDEKKVCEKMMHKEGGQGEGEEVKEAKVNHLPDDLRDEIMSQLTSLKESQDLSQKISLSHDSFSTQEVSSIESMAVCAGLKVYNNPHALVIAKL